MHKAPISVFANLDEKNELCPQSCAIAKRPVRAKDEKNQVKGANQYDETDSTNKLNQYSPTLRSKIKVACLLSF
jgi:hypothetical protein